MACLSLLAGFGTAWWLSAKNAPSVYVPANTRGNAHVSVLHEHLLATSRGPAVPQVQTIISSFSPPALAPIGKIFTNPTEPGYLAADVVASGVRRPGELFSREPRDVVWASQREASLGTFPEREFQLADPDANVEVECRRTMCRVRITSTSPFLTSQFEALSYSCGGALVMGDLELSDDAGKRYADIYVMYHGDSLDQAAFTAHNAAWCAKARAAFLAALNEPFSSE